MPVAARSIFLWLTPVATTFATTVAAICLIGCLAGCDTETHKADQKIRAALADATAKRAVRNDAGNDAARKILDATAKESGASPATQAQLDAMRGQIQFDAALAMIREIDRRELALSSVAFHVGQLAVQLDTGTAIATGYGKYDPKAAKDNLTQLIAAAQGGPDKPTWVYHEVALPTLAAVKQKISELEGQLAKLEEQAKSLSEQRDGKVKEAETENQAADAAKGEESVEHFKKFSALQRESGDLFTQMEATKARTVAIKADLAVQHGQLDVLENVLKEFASQQDSMDAGWKALTQQIDAQSALAKGIVNGEGSAASETTGPLKEGASIAAKAADIGRLAGEIHTLRQQAQTDLDDAAKLFNDAYNAAEQARRDLTNQIDQAQKDKTRADVKAALAMIDIMNPLEYRLREGATRRLIGSLYTSEAASLMNRANLEASVGPIIERSGASVPADLRPGTLAKDASAALEQADVAYKSAENILSGISTGVAIGTNGRDVQNAATVELILTLYGQSHQARLNGSEKAAQDLLGRAIVERNGAVEKKINLPALPAELSPAPPAPPPAAAAAATTAPTTEPTAEPATEPAAEPTTEPAAAPATEPS